MLTVARYIVGFVLIVSLFLSSGVWAQGFAHKGYEDLQKKVTKELGVDGVAQRLSEMKDKSLWKTYKSDDLKLFLAISWFDKGHALAAYNILQNVDVAKTNEKLWHYYKALTYLSFNKKDEAFPHIQYLRQKRIKDVDAVILETLYLVHENKLTVAIAAMTEFIGKNKRDGFAYFHRGYLNLLGLSHKLALQDFEDAYKYLPKERIDKRQQALLQAAMIQLKFFNDTKQANKLFKKGERLNPHSDLVMRIRHQFR